MSMGKLILLYINYFEEETLVSMSIRKNMTFVILEKTLHKAGGSYQKMWISDSIILFCVFLDYNRSLDEFYDHGLYLTKSLVSYNIESFLINWQATKSVKMLHGISNMKNIRKSSISDFIYKTLKWDIYSLNSKIKVEIDFIV